MAENTFLVKLSSGIKHRIQKIFHNPYEKIGLGWLQVKMLKHSSTGKERQINIFRKPLYYISPTELLHGIDEIFVENIYGQEFGNKPYIIDCGANVGMSIISLKTMAPDAVIDAFEPDEANFLLLEKNVRSFDLEDVRLHKAAVWIENTTLNFSAEGSMSSKIEDRDAGGTKGAKVKAVRLKNFLEKTVDFLKIDIEGAEYQVLKDIAGSLHRVKRMFLEYHGTYSQNKELLEIFQMINESGFSFYIKEATSVYEVPFFEKKRYATDWDVQLNIFCIRK